MGLIAAGWKVRDAAQLGFAIARTTNPITRPQSANSINDLLAG